MGDTNRDEVDHPRVNIVRDDQAVQRAKVKAKVKVEMNVKESGCR